MRIGSILEDWIGQRLKIKPYPRWGYIWPCLELNEEGYMPHYRWHDRVTIVHGRALPFISQINATDAHMSSSCPTMKAWCDSPRKDNFKLKIN